MGDKSKHINTLFVGLILNAFLSIAWAVQTLQVYQGNLDATTSKSIDNRFADFFHIRVDSTEHIIVELLSSDFDTYLILASPSGRLYRNDDHEGSTERSLIDLVARESGTWLIIVTTFNEKEAGVYQLFARTKYRFIPSPEYHISTELNRKLPKLFERRVQLGIVTRDPRVLQNVEAAPRESYPEFPWPPPQASATTIIPSELLIKPTTKTFLSDIERKISATLNSLGYDGLSYYAVPGGFVMVTKIEQINPDGTPKAIPNRWATTVEPFGTFSLSAYARALFTATVGYYRVFVFIITSHPFYQSDNSISSIMVLEWLRSGLNRLPDVIGKLEYTNIHKCTALIYEFEQAESFQRAILKIPSNLSGKEHLEKAMILEYLAK